MPIRAMAMTAKIINSLFNPHYLLFGKIALLRTLAPVISFSAVYFKVLAEIFKSQNANFRKKEKRGSCLLSEIIQSIYEVVA